MEPSAVHSVLGCLGGRVLGYPPSMDHPIGRSGAARSRGTPFKGYPLADSGIQGGGQMNRFQGLQFTSVHTLLHVANKIAQGLDMDDSSFYGLFKGYSSLRAKGLQMVAVACLINPCLQSGLDFSAILHHAS